MSLSYYRGGRVSLSNYRGGRVSLSNYRGGRVSLSNYRDGRVPLSNYRGGRVSLSNYRGGRVPLNNYRGGRVPLNNYRGGRVPLNNYRGWWPGYHHDYVTGIGNAHSIYWHSVFRLRMHIYVWLQFSTAIDGIDYVPGIEMGTGRDTLRALHVTLAQLSYCQVWAHFLPSSTRCWSVSM
jgi:hypothetical protein